MKIRDFKRFAQDDFRAAEQWFFDFLDAFNPMVDSLNQVLQGNVDIDNNQQAERQTVTLSHNVPVTIKLQKLKTQPFVVRVGYAAGYVASAAITGFFPDGTFQVTCFFHGTPPTGPVAAMLIMEP